MSNPKNTITINGKLYDASTGNPVGGGAPAHRTTDGITRHVAPVAAQKTSHPSGHVIERSSVSAKAIHQQHDRSKTLVRGAVRNPTTHKRPTSHAAADVHLTPRQKLQPHHALSPKDKLRQESQTPRNKLVSKFGAQHQPVVRKHGHIAVQPAPASQTVSRPIEEIVPKTPASVLLDAALVKAVSHEQPRYHAEPKRRRIARKMGLSPRIVSISASIAFVFLVGAYFTYQNLPRIAMGIAASRAGVPASYPGYTPSGYALAGRITYSPGQIVVNFKSKQDQQSYAITQQQSNWNSEALEDSYVAKLSQNVRTETAAGRKVFLYGDTNATWVDGGIWYRVEGKANLSTDQLLKLAASL